MTKSLTDDPNVYPANLVVPVNGEPRTAESIEAVFQQIGNSRGWLRDRLLFIDPTKEGVRRVWSFATIAALKAVLAANRADGYRAHVVDKGVYRFDAASTTSPVDPLVLRPDDVSGGNPGRWFHELYGMIGQASGVAALDAGSVLAFGTLPSPACRGVRAQANAGSSTTSSSYVDIMGDTVQATAGDLLLMWADARLYGATTSDTPKWRLRIQLPDMSFVTPDYEGNVVVSTSNVNNRVMMMRRYGVTQTGAHTIIVQALSVGGGTIFCQDVVLTSQVWRQ